MVLVSPCGVGTAACVQPSDLIRTVVLCVSCRWPACLWRDLHVRAARIGPVNPRAVRSAPALTAPAVHPPVLSFPQGRAQCGLPSCPVAEQT